jgi:putative spermidine/putrescine transport system substrate-binding protein
MTKKRKKSTKASKADITRRDFMRAAAVTAGGLALASCAPKPEEQATPAATLAGKSFEGKTLHLMTWSDVTGRAAVENIAKSFENRTGAKVETDLIAATSKMVAKIKGAEGNQWADVVILSGVGGYQLQQAGLLERPNPAKLPNIDKVNPRFQFGAVGSAVGYNLFPDDIDYNTDVLSEPPTTWEVLWDEKFAGKLFLPAPYWVEALDLIIMASMLAGSDMYNPEPGFELLEELKGRVVTLAENPPQVAEMLRTGDLHIGGPFSHMFFAEQLKNPDYPIGVALETLEEGFFADLQLMVIPDGHPGDTDVIHGFINEALSTEMQEAMAESVFYTPINMEVSLSQELMDSGYVLGPEQLANAIIPDQEYMAAVQADWHKRYGEMFAA